MLPLPKNRSTNLPRAAALQQLVDARIPLAKMAVAESGMGIEIRD